MGSTWPSLEHYSSAKKGNSHWSSKTGPSASVTLWHCLGKPETQGNLTVLPRTGWLLASMLRSICPAANFPARHPRPVVFFQPQQVSNEILSPELVKVKPVFLFRACLSFWGECPQWVVLQSNSDLSVRCLCCCLILWAPFLPPEYPIPPSLFSSFSFSPTLPNPQLLSSLSLPAFLAFYSESARKRMTRASGPWTSTAFKQKKIDSDSEASEEV